MICEKCEEKIKEDDVFQYAGDNLCEDCYVEIISVPKTCDPMKVRSARMTREMLGQKGSDGLLPIQKEIYDYLKEKGEVQKDELPKIFNLSPKELEKHFSVLRHCELARGFKKNNKIYLTLMD